MTRAELLAWLNDKPELGVKQRSTRTDDIRLLYRLYHVKLMERVRLEREEHAKWLVLETRRKKQAAEATSRRLKQYLPFLLQSGHHFRSLEAGGTPPGSDLIPIGDTATGRQNAGLAPHPKGLRLAPTSDPSRSLSVQFRIGPRPLPSTSPTSRQSYER